jgi:hypothetical protein
MGAGPSLAVTPDIANKLLTDIFTQTDMAAYMSMTDPKACANFDFSSLNSAMQKNLQESGGQLQLLQQGQSARKTAICFEEARGYSKAFEIYAALYPILADSAVKRTGIALLGGMRRVTRRVQKGGAEIATTSSQGYSKMESTPIFPFWFLEGITIDFDKRNDSFHIVLDITKGGRKGLQFDIDKESLKEAVISVPCSVYNKPSQRDIPPATLRIERTNSRRTGDEVHVVSLNNSVIFEFEHGTDGWYISQIVEGREDDYQDIQIKGKRRGTIPIVAALLKKIKEVVGIVDGVTEVAQGRETAYRAPSYGVAPTTSVSGSFFPQGPANIKTSLGNFKTKKKNAPLALAVARALILLRQIDPANSNGGAQTTQICSTRYTFEGKDQHVPRKGIALDKTFYFKSWINLFSDIGEFRQGKYEWTQSSSGKARLDEAARDLSILYSNPQQIVNPDAGFLSKPLPEFIRACPNRIDREYIIPPQILPTIQAIVNELLKVQTVYAAKANAILAKVFQFKADGTVAFHPEILGRKGYQLMSALCVETRNTLFEYYMKVESLFIEGVIIYEKALEYNLLHPV